MRQAISGRIDIGPLWLYMPEALRGSIIIKPSAYSRLTYNYRGGASKNWDLTAAAIDLANFYLRNEMTAPIETIASFLEEQNANRRFMYTEFGSWIYLDLHAGPKLLHYAIARHLGAAGDARWSAIAAGLRLWLRALVGWLAISGTWGPGRTWGRVVGRSGPGARLLVGRDEFSKRIGGVPYCVLAGKRSWDFDDDWKENVFAPVLLSDLGFGIRAQSGDIWKSHNRLMATIESIFGAFDILTPAERQKVVAATRNDVGALEWCISELIRDFLPNEPIVLVRSETGVAIAMLEAAKAPTASIYCSGWEEDGTIYAAGACNGLRGPHGEQVEAGRAEIDLETRSGFCQRTSGPDRVRVDFPLPKGPLVAVIRAQYGTGISREFYRSGVPIAGGLPTPPVGGGSPAPPAGEPETPVRRRRSFFSWLRSKLRRKPRS